MAGYLLAIALTQFLSYFFAPLLPVLAQRYHVTLNTAAWTVLIFPLSSALISGAAGAIADRIGFARSIRSGLTSIAFFSLLRVFHDNFALLITCQFSIGLSIPFVLAPMSSFLAAHCAEEDRKRLTDLCTVFLFAGIGLSFFAAPWLMQNVGYRGTMPMLAVTAILLCILFSFSVSGASPTVQIATPRPSSTIHLLRNRNLVLLCVGGFLGQGCFNAILTWIAALWQGRGFPAQAAGLASSLTIFAGIAGSLLLPPILDRLLGMRSAFFACILPATCLIYPCLFADSPLHGYIAGSLIGFFQFPTLAMTFYVLDQSVSEEHMSFAIGIYWMMSNLGIFLVSYLAGILHSFAGWRAASLFIIMLMIGLFSIICFLHDPAEPEICG
ncbi:hypothetical protein GCM10011586_01010 [Silvibacterium dinghuense]|nr:hypothetical protein GCM10011586_01010 [Silvibacterium dinghuense]